VRGATQIPLLNPLKKVDECLEQPAVDRPGGDLALHKSYNSCLEQPAADRPVADLALDKSHNSDGFFRYGHPHLSVSLAIAALSLDSYSSALYSQPPSILNRIRCLHQMVCRQSWIQARQRELDSSVGRSRIERRNTCGTGGAGKRDVRVCDECAIC